MAYETITVESKCLREKDIFYFRGNPEYPDLGYMKVSQHGIQVFVDFWVSVFAGSEELDEILDCMKRKILEKQNERIRDFGDIGKMKWNDLGVRPVARGSVPQFLTPGCVAGINIRKGELK